MSKFRVRYQTFEIDDLDIHVRSLRDNQQFFDQDKIAESLGISSAQWPIFGIVWASGEVLARLMARQDIVGKRILEVGCGLGLASLVLNERSADITATDYHPEVEAFLKINVSLNSGDEIPFKQSDWHDLDTGLGKFDLVIGSDLLYEVEHIELLSQFIELHAKSECEVIVVDPGRGNHAKFSKAMVKLGFEHSQRKLDQEEQSHTDFKGRILSYIRKL
ncbi:MAG: methyltransferase domain-containing protein [Kangiellaceae bacterium]|nr:methyltransferase domain-containing protein [Kangiellaceae bacterium]